jgi:aspartate/methionine/tyrosine aminotransferase
MQIEPFRLERYFGQYEFTARYLLSPSDCESMSMQELLALADPQSRALWERLGLGYTESAGLPLLREEIAGLYSGISAENILTAVPEEAIFIAMNVLLRPGDRVVVLTPAYQSLHAVARAIGCQVVDWPLVPREGRWELDLKALKDALQRPARLVVVNFPNNPTGFLPTPAEWQELLGLVSRAGATLFSDEMYRLLEHDPAACLPSACESCEHVLSLGGLSKAFGLPGLRSGWLAGSDASLLAQVQSFKDYTTICGSAPGEILSLIALRARESILARNRTLVRSNLVAARSFFTARPDWFEWLEPEAGSVAFPRWCGAQPIMDFAEEIVRRRGVMVVPGEMFGFLGEHFRVGLGRKNLPEVLEVLREYLDEMIKWS